MRKSNIFSFIVGAILFGCIGTVAAYNMLAKDVKYTPKDSTWNVNNVEDAIDELYGKVIKGEILYEENLYDKASLTLKTYEFTESRNAILIVSASHGNDVNSYYHQLNTPTIFNGEMIELYKIGTFNTQLTGSVGSSSNNGLISEYAYLIKANSGTRIEIQAKAYGWGNYRIRLIG